MVYIDRPMSPSPEGITIDQSSHGSSSGIVNWQTSESLYFTSYAPIIPGQGYVVEQALKHELLMLWLDVCAARETPTSSSRMPSAVLYDLARSLMRHYGACVVTYQGEHTIIGGFADASSGLLGAWHVREILSHAGAQTRIGIHYGPIMLEYRESLPRQVSIAGEGIYGAACLARLANPTEILITSTLWARPLVASDQFICIPQHRRFPANAGDKTHFIPCYILALVNFTSVGSTVHSE